MHKVIFLDVDGVLNSDLNQKQNEKYGIWRSEHISLDKSALIVLKQIVEQTGAELVLSSTWRYPEHNGSFDSKENLEKQLAEHNLYLSDVTPLLPGYDRAKEIIEYLHKHKDITHCVILDDDVELNKSSILRRHWVYIDPIFGLKKRHIKDVLQILEFEDVEHNLELLSILNAIADELIVDGPDIRESEHKILMNNVLNAETENELKLHLSRLIRHDLKNNI